MSKDCATNGNIESEDISVSMFIIGNMLFEYYGPTNSNIVPIPSGKDRTAFVSNLLEAINPLVEAGVYDGNIRLTFKNTTVKVKFRTVLNLILLERELGKKGSKFEKAKNTMEKRWGISFLVREPVPICLQIKPSKDKSVWANIVFTQVSNA